MNELNPNHGVTNEIRDQWYKLCAIMLFKSGKREIKITSEDIDQFMNSGICNITVRPQDRVLTLALVSDAEAARLAREEGGLPI